MNPVSREPLWTVAGVTALVTALVTLATSFGLALTRDQTEAILALTAVLAPLIVAAVGRGMVTPNASVIEYTDDGQQVLPGEAEPPMYEPGPAHARDDDGDGRPDYTPEED